MFHLHPWVALLGGVILGASVHAADPAASPTLVPSEDGAYVIDTRARLMWPRCVEGMQWVGKTCIGTPRRLTHAEAVALANARWKSEGVRWRLPRTLELKRLLNKSANPPGVDPQMFPGAPRDWLWSGSSNVHIAERNPYSYDSVAEGRTAAGTGDMAFRQGWAVNLQTGESRGDVGKATRLPVRLVRPYEPDTAPADAKQ